jgi:hypothetical protein
VRSRRLDENGQVAVAPPAARAANVTERGREPKIEDSPARAGPRLRQDPAVAVALLVSGVLVANAWSWISKPFGNTHDGRNGALWSLAGEAALQDPIGSHLGSGYRPGAVYAHHPPLIVAMTAIGRLFGTGPFASRLPAIIATAVTLVLLVALLRALRCSTGAIVAGLLAMASAPMFLVYGTMVDTPMVSLPVGVAVLLVAVRIRDGRSPPAAGVIAVFALAPLGSWQGVILASVVTAALVAHSIRVDAGRRPAAHAVIGTSIGGALSLTWLWAATGSLRGLLEQGADRASSVPLAEWIDRQRAYADDLWPVTVVALAAMLGLFALTDRRVRPVLAITVGVVLASLLGFRQGAFNHDYWNYWGLLIVALAVGTGTDRLARRLGERGRTSIAIVVALTAFSLLTGVTNVSISELNTIRGSGSGTAVDRYVASDDFDPDAPIAVIAGPGDAYDWVFHAARRSVVPIASQRELRRLVDESPGAVALVGIPEDPTDLEAIRRAALVESGGYFMVPATAAMPLVP